MDGFYMGASSTDFIDYVMELLEPISVIEGGKFFGGYGIKCQSVQFAMIMGNTLYFVVNDNTRGEYEEAGSKPFSYLTKKGQRLVKRYYEVPADLLEDQDELLAWARESILIAKATNRKKSK